MTARSDASSNQTPALETIEVVHFGRSNGAFDVYGGRRDDSGLKHMNNTEPGEPGWLGNPYQMLDDSVSERRRVIARYVGDFLLRVEDDAEFRAAVQGLRGDRVACWCRGVSQDRTEDNWCHLDVVEAWLDGDLSTVWQYLRGETA